MHLNGLLSTPDGAFPRARSAAAHDASSDVVACEGCDCAVLAPTSSAEEAREGVTMHAPTSSAEEAREGVTMHIVAFSGEEAFEGVTMPVVALAGEEALEGVTMPAIASAGEIAPDGCISGLPLHTKGRMSPAGGIEEVLEGSGCAIVGGIE